MRTDAVVVLDELVQLLLKLAEVTSRGRLVFRYFFNVWWNLSTFPQVCGW